MGNDCSGCLLISASRFGEFSGALNFKMKKEPYGTQKLTA